MEPECGVEMAKGVPDGVTWRPTLPCGSRGHNLAGAQSRGPGPGARSSAGVMAAAADGASTVTPRSEAEGCPSEEVLSPTPPDLTAADGASTVTPRSEAEGCPSEEVLSPTPPDLTAADGASSVTPRSEAEGCPSEEVLSPTPPDLMAADGASTVTPKSEAEGYPSEKVLSPTPPGLTDLPEKVTQPAFPPQNWHQEKPRKSSRVLKELGAVHVVIALVYLFIGGYLVAAVKNLHLVVQKCWYPFWGAASFLISGILAITMESFQKNYLKVCLVANSISFLCVLAGLFVIVKDLFLETPFEFPIWKPYPSDTVHIQRLVLALLCVTCVEVFLPGLMAVMAYRDTRLSAEEDDLPLVPDSPLELKEQSMMPPPSYEDVTQGDLQDKQERR
ncbi:hypothetical protein AB1E18_019172 [Capra hircus]